LATRDFRYSTIIAAATFVALLLVSAIAVWSGYWFAQKVLEQELNRQKQHLRLIVELHFQKQLLQLQSYVRGLARDPALLLAIRAEDNARMDAILRQAFHSPEGLNLDILFLVPRNSEAPLDVSPNPSRTGPIVTHAANHPAPGVVRLLRSDPVHGVTVYALVKGTRIIDPDTGNAVARLIAGIMLNDNSRILQGLLERTELASAALTVEETELAHAARDESIDPGTKQNGQPGSETSLTISFSAAAGPPLVLKVATRSNPADQLRATYFGLLPVIAGLILALSLALSVIVRTITKRSLSKLANYATMAATTAGEHSEIPAFEPGPIEDFNNLGSSIEQVFDVLRTSENRAEAVIDRAPALIFAKDLNGRYTIANSQFLSTFDFSRDQVIGKADNDLFTEDFILEMRAFETAASERGEGAAREVTLTTPSGERVFLGASFPLRTEAGDTYAHCTILSDITDRKKVEIALLHAKEEAEFANSAKTSFLAGVSHELRTPLNAIIGFSEMIASEVLGRIENRNYVDYARHIQSSGTHLLSLIGDVLDLSVIESRKETVREEALDVEELGEDCLRMIREQAAEAGVEVRAEMDMRGHALKADARRIRQILINLLTNAVKFTPAGGHVVLTCKVGKDRRVLLSVTDDGIGMDRTTQAHAFEPFMQGNSSMVRKAEGAGLGLALVKRLTELHNAELHCTSAPGKGTTMTIIFPASRSVSAPPHIQAETPAD
jgi:PAS domain S-box-containing protein